MNSAYRGGAELSQRIPSHPILPALWWSLGGQSVPTVDTTRCTTESLSREERIRLRAESIYRQRGNRPGSAMEDWIRAEREIREDEDRAIDEASEESFPASDPPVH
jgi:hypothetical protein